MKPPPRKRELSKRLSVDSELPISLYQVAPAKKRAYSVGPQKNKIAPKRAISEKPSTAKKVIPATDENKIAPKRAIPAEPNDTGSKETDEIKKNIEEMKTSIERIKLEMGTPQIPQRLHNFRIIQSFESTLGIVENVVELIRTHFQKSSI